ASGTTFNAVVNQVFTGRVASFTDGNRSPDLADFSATIAWGDGMTSAGSITANGTGGFDVSGTHTYTALGTFTVTVTIHDAGGSSAVAHSKAVVASGPSPLSPWSPGDGTT